jgi:hypothetical protein
LRPDGAGGTRQVDGPIRIFASGNAPMYRY